MALPRPDYGDPSDVAERRERRLSGLKLSETCYGCSANTLTGQEYTCLLGEPAYPRSGKDLCTWFVRRRV